MVSCQPADTDLQKPLILTLPHSACNIEPRTISIQSTRFTSCTSEDLEWITFPKNDTDINESSDTIRIHTTRAGCFTPCYAEGTRPIVNTLPDNSGAGSGASLMPATASNKEDSQKKPKQNGNGSDKDKSDGNGDKSDGNGDKSDGNGDKIEGNAQLMTVTPTKNTEVKMVALLFASIPSLECNDKQPIPLRIYITRADAKDRVLANRSLDLVEHGYFHFECKCIHDQTLTVLVKIQVNSPWCITPHVFGQPSKYKSSKSITDDTLLKIRYVVKADDEFDIAHDQFHIAHRDFHCMKPAESTVDAIQGAFQVCRRRHPSDEELTSLTFTTRRSGRPKGRKEMNEDFNRRNLCIVWKCLRKVMDVAGKLVVSKCATSCKCPRRSDSTDERDWLWKMINCKNLKTQATEMAKKLKRLSLDNMHHVCASIPEGLNEEEAKTEIDYMTKLIGSLLPAYQEKKGQQPYLFPDRDATDKAHYQLKIKTAMITDESKKEIENVKIIYIS